MIKRLKDPTYQQIPIDPTIFLKKRQKSTPAKEDKKIEKF